MYEAALLLMWMWLGFSVNSVTRGNSHSPARTVR